MEFVQYTCSASDAPAPRSLPPAVFVCGARGVGVSTLVRGLIASSPRCEGFVGDGLPSNVADLRKTGRRPIIVVMIGQPHAVRMRRMLAGQPMSELSAIMLEGVRCVQKALKIPAAEVHILDANRRPAELVTAVHELLGWHLS